jgi:hypothetical protein
MTTWRNAMLDTRRCHYIELSAAALSPLSPWLPLVMDDNDADPYNISRKRQGYSNNDKFCIKPDLQVA